MATRAHVLAINKRRQELSAKPVVPTEKALSVQSKEQSQPIRSTAGFQAYCLLAFQVFYFLTRPVLAINSGCPRGRCGIVKIRRDLLSSVPLSSPVTLRNHLKIPLNLSFLIGGLK